MKLPEDVVPSLIEHTPDATVVLSTDGRIRYWNRAAEALYGYARDEVEEQSFLDLVVPPAAREDALDRLRRGEGEPGHECVRRRKDGTSLYVMASQAALSSDEGPLVMDSARDVTAMRVSRQAEALRLEWRGRLEYLPDAILAVNDIGRIVLTNGQAETLFGFSPGALIGQPIEVLVPLGHRGSHRASREGYAAGPHVRPMGSGLDLRARRADGSELPVDISLSPCESEAGSMTLCAVRDVSGHRSLEALLRQRGEELAQRNRQLEEATRHKSEFLANMSHELRTPLNAIIGFSEMLHDGRGTTPETQAEFLGYILASSRHLLSLVNDVLDMAKVEAGAMQLDLRPTDLTALISHTAASLRPLAASRGIEIDLELADLGLVLVDPGRVRQVLYNYLSNAVKFSRQGGRIRVRARGEGEATFRVEVEDEGPGIRPEDLERLFVEFQQLDAGAAKEHQGTGLGLALTRRLVELHGGHVGAHSELGRGSTFFAVFPRDRVEVSTDPEDPSQPCILVIEDEPQDTAWLVDTLQASGFATDSATSGAEALEKAAARRYAAITLDLVLPDMTGWEVLQKLRAEGSNRDVPVVVVSVSASEETCMGYVVDDVLAKPVDASMLLRALARAGVHGHRRVVVVDDEPQGLRGLDAALLGQGYDPIYVRNGSEALEAVALHEPVAVIFVVGLTGMASMTFLQRLRTLPAGAGASLIAVRSGRDAPESPASPVRVEKSQSLIEALKSLIQVDAPPSN